VFGLKKERPVLTVHFGDTHVGSSLALWPRGMTLRDGGGWLPSGLQDWYLDRWIDFWDDTAALKKKHQAWCVGISGGDERDGDHHGTKQLTSAFEDDQDQAVRAVYAIAESVVDEWVYVRGTESHGCGSERYARDAAERGLKVIPNGDHWSHWIYTGIHGGVKFEVAHAPGTKSWVPNTRGVSCARHAQYTRKEYHESGLEPPDVVIRHHIHYWQGPGCDGETCCFLIPGWQDSSDYVKNKGVMSATASNFIQGGLRILCQGGNWRHFWWLRRPEPAVAWAT